MVTVENLTKCYGSFTAVSNLSFEIGGGHVYQNKRMNENKETFE